MNVLARIDNAMLDELSAEHDTLLPEIAALGALARRGDHGLATAIERVSARLGAELERHIAREDGELFPFFAHETGDAGLVKNFTDEHREILRLRDALLKAHSAGAGTEVLGQLVEPLADLLAEHMTKEDMMLFPAIRELLH